MSDIFFSQAKTEQRLEHLEVQIAYQDETIATLNMVILQLQSDIRDLKTYTQQLEGEMTALKQDDSAGPVSLSDQFDEVTLNNIFEKPPHY